MKTTDDDDLNAANYDFALNVLTYVALSPPKQFTDADITMWMRTLDDKIIEGTTSRAAAEADAIEAVDNYRASNADWMQPAHVNAGVRALRKARIERAGVPPIPGDLTLELESAWRDEWFKAVRAGQNRDGAAISASLALNMPPEMPAVEGARKAALMQLVSGLAARKSIGRPEPLDRLTPEVAVQYLRDVSRTIGDRQSVQSRGVEARLQDWDLGDAVVLVENALSITWIIGQFKNYDLSVRTADHQVIVFRVPRPRGAGINQRWSRRVEIEDAKEATS